MGYSIKNINSLEDLISYFSENLNWGIDLDCFDDIDDITYDFSANDLGLKEEAFAKISSLKQLRPIMEDNQPWGIFCVEFDSNHFEITALRKILSCFVPKRRNSAEHTVWNQENLLFLCFWGNDNNRTIGIAHFQNKESGGLPQIKMISCSPACEDQTQLNVFEERLKQLHWPDDVNNVEKWNEHWASAFVTSYHEVINNSAELTSQLALQAQKIRENITQILKVETEDGYVHRLFREFQIYLVQDMTESDFADMYAQTVVYGLFTARCMDDSQENFSIEEAVNLMPKTNPFLQSLMKKCLSGNIELSFDELEIQGIVDLLTNTNTEEIIKDFNRQTGDGREDPIIHFYEDFIKAYNSKQKMELGVFYTPQPVVDFIVNSVDCILKTEFNIAEGLASEETKKIKVESEDKKKDYYEDVPAIQILDPATGTGTFIRKVILQIYDNFREKHKGESDEAVKAAWNEYVPKHLLPRLNAFEIMIAPYAVAHMKNAMVLKETGYDFKSSSRLQIYLTDTLAEPKKIVDQEEIIGFFGEDNLAKESKDANRTKENSGINIVIGNPPYRVASTNTGEWIVDLIKPYKMEPGGKKKLNERNPKPLNDDYVKFIRVGEEIINTSGSGVLAFINNNGFIDNVTFRGMRWHLLKTFDKIYILNLNGNFLIDKTSENDDKRDESVFEIGVGVSINIFVKSKERSEENARVFYADLFGPRAYKYDLLRNSDLSKINWTEIKPFAPSYLFRPLSDKNMGMYMCGSSIVDLMPLHDTGITTSRDSLVIDTSKEKVIDKIKLFSDMNKSDEEIEVTTFKTIGSKSCKPKEELVKVRSTIANNNHEEKIQKILYRPFDIRYIYYDHNMLDRDRRDVFYNLLSGENWGLVTCRQAAVENWSNIEITKYMADHGFQKTVGGISKEFPLYIYSKSINGDLLEKTANFDPEILHKYESILKRTFTIEENCDRSVSFSALNMLDYIYAILFSPHYREQYNEYLKIDFPRIPFPVSADSFFKLADLGEKLRLLHTSEDDCWYEENEFIGEYPVEVDSPTYKDSKIVLNNSGSCITNVPENIWLTFFDGYQALKHWLSDRINTTLQEADIHHLQHIIYVLTETDKIMQELDKYIWF